MSEELNARIAELLHYPRCWDTAAYPTVFDAMIETAGAAGCSVCMQARIAELERVQAALVAALETIKTNAGHAEFVWRRASIELDAMKPAPKDDGPEFSDGCSKEGFPGGCERMGCCEHKLPAGQKGGE